MLLSQTSALDRMPGPSESGGSEGTTITVNLKSAHEELTFGELGLVIVDVIDTARFRTG